MVLHPGPVLRNEVYEALFGESARILFVPGFLRHAQVAVETGDLQVSRLLAQVEVGRLEFVRLLEALDGAIVVL